MAMAQALSEEEFHRMQAQLLELRTQNYQLSDDLRKNSAELTALRQKTVVLERDFGKAQKALSKSKKAQEVEALLGETAMLQGKLHSQEEDFRLQNNTLMTELSKLCTQIEQLEQDNQQLKEVGGANTTSPAPSAVPDSAPGHDDAELLRMQAENSALQKKIAALQEHYEQEVQRLSSSTDTPSTTSSSGQDETDAGAGEQAGPEPGPRAKQIMGRSEKSIEKMVGMQAGWSALCPLTPCFGAELEVALNTEQEEKRLLREHIHTLEASKQTEVTKLQEDVNKNTAELREQLQSKEKQHEVALHTMRDQAASQSAVSQEQVEIILQENDALRTNLAALEQIQTLKTQEVNLLREQQGALSAELQQRRAEQETLLAQRDDLTSQIQESSFASRKLLEQLAEEGQEKERLQRELEDARKTAERRKVMLDDIATQLNQEKSGHKEALSDLKLQHEKEVLAVRARYEKELRGLHEEKNRCEEEIRQQLREEKTRSKDLEGCQQTVVELQAQVQSMEETKGWFERRLRDAEEIKDKVDGQRILEKKGSLEELVLSELSSPSRTQQTGDSSSTSGGSTPPPQRSADLSDEEVGELFQRLALVQQEKWMLEEKMCVGVPAPTGPPTGSGGAWGSGGGWGQCSEIW
ncbi:hypothetical protein CRUP_010838 [Coryphaenoides rupestris]|nr:hypothetical protein CRUP_010838 [Coryphaenoides rupestris]